MFHRAAGFYPLDLSGDSEAIKNAEVNAGTLLVTDLQDRVVWSAPSWIEATQQTKEQQ